MEIIQTIWSALTTENEFLANILTTPLVFLEAFVIMLLFTTLFKLKPSNLQKLIYVLSISILSLITRYIIPDPYGTILNIISIILIIKLVFKLSFLKSIFSIIIPMLIIALVEAIISNTYIKVFNITFDQLIYIPIHKFIVTLFIYIIIAFTSILLKFFPRTFVVLDPFSKRNKLMLIIFFCFIVITITAQIIITTFYNKQLPFIITFLSMFTLLSYFALTIIISRKITALELTKIDLQETKMYNKTLSILHDNIRGFKHDFNNILQAISGYIDTNDMSGLKKYYSELQVDCQRANNLSALNPDSINNPAIYSILASKYHKADELGIKVNLEVFLDLNKLNMKIYEFTRILGILLDNAIEATSECEEKLINVYIRKDFNIKRQLLIIENTYNNKNIDTEKIFEKGYSTKDKNTGLGLWEIRQILNKNNNLNLYTSKDDKLFKQQLEIY